MKLSQLQEARYHIEPPDPEQIVQRMSGEGGSWVQVSQADREYKEYLGRHMEVFAKLEKLLDEQLEDINDQGGFEYDGDEDDYPPYEMANDLVHNVIDDNHDLFASAMSNPTYFDRAVDFFVNEYSEVLQY